MPDAVAEKVLSTVAAVKRVPCDGLSLDSSLAELGLDSLDTITLLFELENKFQISIPDEEARSIHSVRDIVEGVKKLLARASPDPATAAE